VDKVFNIVRATFDNVQTRKHYRVLIHSFYLIKSAVWARGTSLAHAVQTSTKGKPP
jgi:hypothetical protein